MVLSFHQLNRTFGDYQRFALLQQENITMAMLTFLLLLCAAIDLNNAQKPNDKDILKNLLNNLPKVSQEPQSRSLSCPSGWAVHEKNCYQYVPILSSWTDAERICLQLGGNLASVHSISQHNFLLSIIQNNGEKNPIWIGANDAVKEGVWLWSDGSAFNYQKWTQGEPNNYGGQENCMHMNYGGERGQNDANCGAQYSFMCSRKM